MPSLGRVFALLTWGLALLAASLAVGCKPQVGDSCKLSTDCSVTGDRLCDTSQPDGYCTIFNCDTDTCPGESVCAEFHPGNNPPHSSTRHSRRFCVASCQSASDCRSGYVCVAVAVLPQKPNPDRDVVIIDNDPSRNHICLP